MVQQNIDPLRAALKLPNGARFFQCALQVNPYEYLITQNKPSRFNSEDEYNEAIIQKCLEIGIEVIGVTDHYRSGHSVKLVETARKKGLHAFNGFEAVTKDGVHFLCLFDKDKDEFIERHIGECEVRDPQQPSPIGNIGSSELLDKSKIWGAACIAAHVAGKGGLLHTLSGQSRIRLWKHSDLLACCLPGPIDAAPKKLKPILLNKNKEYERERSIAILNASDVNQPEDLEKDRSSCFIKMSKVSIEAFRQAFLDPESRIRLHSDPVPQKHVEFLAMTWEGGFLRDTTIHFNENLNVLIGGRGTGKSTMIESIRYVLDLDPLGEEAKKTYESIVKNVLQSGTKVSLFVRLHNPSEQYYTIERSVHNPPIVKNENGKVLDLTPEDVIPGVNVFGQHEISELTRNPVKLTSLLDRFTKKNLSLKKKKSNIFIELGRSRNTIKDVLIEKENIEDQLSNLPGLEETEKQFRQVGLEEFLKEKSLLIREERLFSSIEERLENYKEFQQELSEQVPVDTSLVSDKVIEDLPNSQIFKNVQGILNTFSNQLNDINKQFDRALNEADLAIKELKSNWENHRQGIEKNYEELLRDLQNSNIDGEEFIQIRKQIEELRPLGTKKENLDRDLKTHLENRRQLIAEWEDIQAEEYRQLETVAAIVSEKLRNRVNVKVTMSGNRVPFENLLREIGGNLASAIKKLKAEENFSLREFANRCREGKNKLIKYYNLSPVTAEKIAQAEDDFFMRIEELELPSTTEIELNTSPVGEQPSWQTLEKLSTGQKATAVLLLLLLESETPLVVDQPEDDLDNRFITESVVSIIRQEKKRRQLIFATHNANIPVLGDAECILGFDMDKTKLGQDRIAKDHMGSLDSKPVRELVEDILEGGKTAFEIRRSKYGF